MRKQLAIGVSVLALTAIGGVSENNFISDNQSGVHSQYTHFVRTSLNQTFESLSRASLAIGLPNRANYQTAGVHFIVGDQGADFGNDDAKNNDFSDPSGENCKRLGYSVTSCASGLFNSACPYNDKIYDRCCDVTYKYTSANCSSPKKLSSDTCGGKHRCYCDTTTYPYASCNSPQIKGSSCTDDTGTRYATCVCPGSVATPYGCETYYASPCNNVCQKAYTDNCRNRTAVQTPYGCETYFSDCSSKCQKAYTDNCRNRTAVIASCPTNADCNYFADCKSKVQSWSCKSGFVKSGNSCVNPCDLRTAVISSCPANATCKYFSDCSSKIQSWSCNSGYNKSGNSCVQAIKVGSIVYGDGTVSNDIITSKTPVGIVLDPLNRLAVAITSARQDGTEGDEYMTWSSSYCDTPNLDNCTDSKNLDYCATDGSANTKAIVASSCNGETYAANAANRYEPSGCISFFCKRQKWFLPSMRELGLLANNQNIVIELLDKLSPYGAQPLSTFSFWSSNEYGGTGPNGSLTAWYASPPTGSRSREQKNYAWGTQKVRPFVKF